MSNSKIQVDETTARHVFTENQTRFPNSIRTYVRKQIILTKKNQMDPNASFNDFWFILSFLWKCVVMWK